MKDSILYIQNFLDFVQYLSTYAPEFLSRNESGDVIAPPIVTGFTRTPACVNGNALMVYSRMTQDEVDEWRGTEGVEVLAETEYTGRGTAARLIEAIEADPDLLAKYESVHDRTPVTHTDEEGEEYTVTPPRIFGIMAGAGGNL